MKFHLLYISVSFCGLLHAQQTNADMKTAHISVKKPLQKAFVSPEKMNVFYAGVDNAVSVTVPGITPDKISATISTGKIKGSNGEYIVTVSTPGQETKIEVFTADESGQKTSRGITIFRIKRVPSPVCFISSDNSGSSGDCYISKSDLQSMNIIEARMESFDFDLSWDVTSFDMVAMVDGNYKVLSSNSSLLTKEQKQLLSTVAIGSHIIIQNVRIKGPDTRIIQGANITVQ